MSSITMHNPRLVRASADAQRVAVTLAPCECCGGTHHERIATKRGYPLRRCRDCGVVFVSPAPTAGQLDALYQKSAGYFATAQTDLTSIPRESALWLDNVLIKHGIASGKFLDVGCANGALIHSMRGLGWDVSGVDVNGDAVEIARKHNLNCTVGTLESASFPDNAFDVVYLGDVIEHVPSPRRTLAEVRRILRPRGLVVLRTPNARCGFAALTLAAARVMRCSWAHSEAPYHLHEFTRKSLRVLLESLGFHVEWNDAEGSSRFLYKLGASGMFDELKRHMKQKGAGCRLTADVLPHLPALVAVGAALAPAYAVGKVLDIFTRGGSALFVGARKPQPGALNS